jgi:hypothetical protein
MFPPRLNPWDTQQNVLGTRSVGPLDRAQNSVLTLALKAELGHSGERGSAARQ